MVLSGASSEDHLRVGGSGRGRSRSLTGKRARVESSDGVACRTVGELLQWWGVSPACDRHFWRLWRPLGRAVVRAVWVVDVAAVFRRQCNLQWAHPAPSRCALTSQKRLCSEVNLDSDGEWDPQRREREPNCPRGRKPAFTSGHVLSGLSAAQVLEAQGQATETADADLALMCSRAEFESRREELRRSGFVVPG